VLLTAAEAGTTAVLVLELEAEPETVAWALPELEAAGLAGVVLAVETDAEAGVVSGTAAALGRLTLMTVEEPDVCTTVLVGVLALEALLPEPLALETLVEPLLVAPLFLEPLLADAPLLETPLLGPLLVRAELSVLSVVTTIPGP
jgi:hypothetical protein